ncbi:pyridoxamine 5'-phosphate oxidase family protein [Marimonas lutisalis]|uniref:pyridoxamine 5'-phosphate oxidase family protein n=1 Tax=Marimonas lutisalis TaxID=2545756 RepID=UPI0010F997A7|nr:pyridoxamine 5'-phosphate oxidase family protein [Marimonas lutisalis]
MFHDGHRELQDRYDGRRLADALETYRRLDQFGPDEVALIEGAEFFFLATAHGRSVDCSFKGGAPGFVSVTGPTTLEWTDTDGNSQYRSLGNILKSPRAGLLFIRFGPEAQRLRVNGNCTLAEVETPLGPKLRVTLEADEIFPNCPRYIPDLAGGAPSPYLPDETGMGKKPWWKDLEPLRDALPENDPHRD